MIIKHHPPVGRVALGLALAPLGSLLIALALGWWLRRMSPNSMGYTMGAYSPGLMGLAYLYVAEIVVGLPCYLLARLLRMNSWFWYVAVPPILSIIVGGLLSWNIITLWLGAIFGLWMIPATLTFWFIVRPDRYKRVVVANEPVAAT